MSRGASSWCWLASRGQPQLLPESPLGSKFQQRQNSAKAAALGWTKPAAVLGVCLLMSSGQTAAALPICGEWQPSMPH